MIINIKNNNPREVHIGDVTTHADGTVTTTGKTIDASEVQGEVRITDGVVYVNGQRIN